MDTVSYTLKAEEQDSFLGGLIRAGDDRELDLADALQAGDGVITVDLTDYQLVNALDAVEALKRVSPDGEPEVTVGKYDGVTVPELREQLRNRELPTGGNRDELVERLEADDHGVDPLDDLDPDGEGDDTDDDDETEV